MECSNSASQDSLEIKEHQATHCEDCWNKLKLRINGVYRVQYITESWIVSTLRLHGTLVPFLTIKLLYYQHLQAGKQRKRILVPHANHTVLPAENESLNHLLDYLWTTSSKVPEPRKVWVRLSQAVSHFQTRARGTAGPIWGKVNLPGFSPGKWQSIIGTTGHSCPKGLLY